MLCELKPSMLATGLRLVRACCNLGTPWMDRGSFIRVGSNLAGVRPETTDLSPGSRLVGGVAEADRHK